MIREVLAGVMLVGLDVVLMYMNGLSRVQLWPTQQQLGWHACRQSDAAELHCSSWNITSRLSLDQAGCTEVLLTAAV
jgi:hypothetical protein